MQTIINLVLNWVLSKVMDWLAEYYKYQRAKKEIEKKNKEIREKTEAAETAAERDSSAKDVIGGF